ncbi:MAG: GntR family transcriptional regulator [Sedimentisphaeraceae bacterium JB056]
MAIVAENKGLSIEAVAKKIELDIKELKLEKGARLQPLRELAVKYDTSYITIRKAIDILCKQGLLYSRRGAGVYVNSSFDYSDEITKEGLTLSLLFCGIKRHIASSSAYSRLIYGMEKEADIAGCNFFMSFLRDSAEIEENDICSNSDGFLMLGDDRTPNLKQFVGRKPAVWVMGPDKRWGDHFTYNNISIGTIAAKYAIEAGFNSYANINVDPIVGSERYNVFNGYIKSNGYTATSIEGYDALILGEFEQHLDYDLVKRWVDDIVDNSQLPLIIFLASEMLTSVVHNFLAAKGLDIGKDVQIITCSETEIAAGISPRPVEIDLCTEEIGRLAIRHLMWRIDNPNARRVVLKLEPEIIRSM